jgi:hypothetical protein
MMSTSVMAKQAGRRRGGRPHVFPVHQGGRSIHNRGMIVGGSGSHAITRSAALGVGAVSGFGAIIAMFCGAMALLHVARIAANHQAHERARRLHSLRRAIVGARKNQLISVLGSPRATIGRGDYRTDDTWYYPLDQRRHVALAIEFTNGIARRTHIITGT